MFYDVFLELCKNKNVAPTRAALDIGLSKSTPTAWKNRGLTPQGDTLNRIADYFNVPVGSLLSTEKAKTPPTEDREELLRFALWDGDKGITPAQIDEVKRFAAFIKERDKNNGK